MFRESCHVMGRSTAAVCCYLCVCTGARHTGISRSSFRMVKHTCGWYDWFFLTHVSFSSWFSFTLFRSPHLSPADDAQLYPQRETPRAFLRAHVSVPVLVERDRVHVESVRAGCGASCAECIRFSQFRGSFGIRRGCQFGPKEPVCAVGRGVVPLVEQRLLGESAFGGHIVFFPTNKR